MTGLSLMHRAHTLSMCMRRFDCFLDDLPLSLSFDSAFIPGMRGRKPIAEGYSRLCPLMKAAEVNNICQLSHPPRVVPLPLRVCSSSHKR